MVDMLHPPLPHTHTHFTQPFTWNLNSFRAQWCWCHPPSAPPPDSTPSFTWILTLSEHNGSDATPSPPTPPFAWNFNSEHNGSDATPPPHRLHEILTLSEHNGSDATPPPPPPPHRLHEILTLSKHNGSDAIPGPPPSPLDPTVCMKF